MYNHVGIMGRRTADPELRQTVSGLAVTSFSLACQRGRKGPNGESAADFFTVVAWRGTAELAAKYLTKGRLVVVEGRLQTRKWVADDGTNRHVVEIVASAIHFADSKKSESAGDPPTPQGGPVNPDDFEEIEDDGDLPF